MKLILGFALLISTASAAIHSGHASAELLTSSATYRAGTPVAAAIRLKLDPGWHTYWINPGEGGMVLDAKWVLPEGWKAGELGWPMPIRFKTGDLPGFGYVDELVLPVTLFPPEKATSPAKLSVKLDWLTCDESACIPGSAQPDVELAAGEPQAGPSAQVIVDAKVRVPEAVAGLDLDVADAGKNLSLVLRAPTGLDPSGFKVFPVTRNVVDAAAVIQFAKAGDTWTAIVAKSEYLEGAPTQLELAMSGGKLSRPALVTWKKK